MRNKTGVVVLLLATLVAPAAHAKGEDEGGVSFGAGIETAYDSNVWRLAPDKINRPGTDTQSDEKFYDMESASDLVLSLYGRVGYEFQGVSGKDARVRIQPGASVFFANGSKTHATLDADLTHGVWKGGDVFVRAGVTPAQFQKNYLVSADPDGSNKVFDQAVSTEAGLSAGVDSRITKTLDGKVWIGGGIETFNAPFDNRSRSILELGGALGLELSKTVALGLGLETARASTGSDVEPFVEGGIRVDTSTDRSYQSVTVNPSVKVELADTIDLRAQYELGSRSYSSSGTNDPYRGRSDLRHTLSTSARFQITKPLRIETGLLFARAITDRPNDDDRSADEVDYQRIVAWVGLAASF